MTESTNSTPARRNALATARALLVLLRPRQWLKNGFVMAPLIFSEHFLQPLAIRKALLATLLFCCASSITYIINDIVDIERDRKHPKKSLTRPMASGALTVPMAAALALLLSVALLAGGWLFQPDTLLVIIAYLLLSGAYSFGLKRQPVLDIFILALGFVLRVYAGAVALSVPLSSWMSITTLCLALYLAAIKRRQELRQNGAEARKVLEHYSVALVDRYAEMSATAALVFYSLFVMSAKPAMVITIPFVLYGLYRYWYVVEMLEGGESPTDALLIDWQLQLTIICWIAACIWALLPAVVA